MQNRRKERDQQEARRALRKKERALAGLEENKADSRSDDGLQANERRVVDDVADEAAEDEKPNFLVKEAAYVLADAIDLLASDRRLAERVKSFGALDGSRLD